MLNQRRKYFANVSVKKHGINFLYFVVIMLIECPFQFSFVYKHIVKSKQFSFLETSLKDMYIGI